MNHVCRLLDTFDFKTLLIEDMGWNLVEHARPLPMTIDEITLTQDDIPMFDAQLTALIGGVW